MEPAALRTSASRRRSRGGSGDGRDPGGVAEQGLPARMLAAIVIGSVLAIGTVHVTVLAVVSAVAFAAAAVSLYRSARAPQGLSIPLPTLLCAALAGYTLLQAIPMPIGWLRVVAPANADVWDRCLGPLGEPGPSWASISLDPGASFVEVLKWTVYGAVFAVAAAVASRRGASWGVASVFIAAAAAALTTLVHGLAGATHVYGLYQPGFNALPWHIGPLLNANNLAGYLNLGVLCGLGLLLSHRPLIPRWLVGVGVTLIVGIDVSSGSRGGVLALPIGMVALALLTRQSRGSGANARQRASSWLMVFAVAAGGVLAALGDTEKLWAELYDKNLSKVEMILWAKPLLRDYPIFGIGRGAFESVFPLYRVTPGNVVYTHAENFPAQWLAEWGVPVGLAALVAFGWAFAPRRLGAERSALAAGAWAGVAVLALQNMVDLALEVPAVCIGVVTVLGSLWGDRRRHAPREEARSTGPLEGPVQVARGHVRSIVLQGAWARAVPVGIAALGALLIGASMRSGWHDVASDRLAVRRGFEAARALEPGPVASLRGELRRAMARHPAEPYFPLMGALVAFHARDQSPIPWLQRTLERGQVNGRAHLLLAEVLAAQGRRRQALLELRLSFENDEALLAQAAVLAVRWTRSFDELLVAVPEGLPGSRVLIVMARYLVAPADVELRGRCDREAILRDPRAIEPRVREVDARLTAMAKGATGALCADRAHCHAEILEHVEALTLADPDTSTATHLRARLLALDDKPEEGARLLERTCERVTDRVACLRARVAVAAQVKAADTLDAAVKDLLGSACVTSAACADTASWIGEVRTGRGELGAALVLFTRAAREDPSQEARWLRLATVAARAGSHATAVEALEKVARRRGGADPELRRRIDEERALAMGGWRRP
jgi:hypothetical protein